MKPCGEERTRLLDLLEAGPRARITICAALRRAGCLHGQRTLEGLIADGRVALVGPDTYGLSQAELRARRKAGSAVAAKTRTEAAEWSEPAEIVMVPVEACEPFVPAVEREEPAEVLDPPPVVDVEVCQKQYSLWQLRRKHRFLLAAMRRHEPSEQEYQLLHEVVQEIRTVKAWLKGRGM